ncbi:hypothetical protein OSTOST_25524 [Ostertagia ostertagi]
MFLHLPFKCQFFQRSNPWRSRHHVVLVLELCRLLWCYHASSVHRRLFHLCHPKSLVLCLQWYYSQHLSYLA